MPRSFPLSLPIVALVASACASSPPPKPEQPEAKVGASPRVDQVTDMYQMINTGEYDRILTTVNDNVELYTPGEGKSEGKGSVRGNYEIAAASFPGYQRTPTTVIESDIAVVVEYILSGTQQGPFMGYPPLGKSIGVQGLSIFQFIDSQIGAIKRYQDTYSLVDQLREGGTTAPAETPVGEPYVIPRGLDQGMTDRVKAWVAALTTQNLHPSPDFYADNATFRLMVNGAASEQAEPLLDVLAELRDSSPNLAFDNVWVYPAEEFAVVTMLAAGLAANPALAMQAATVDKPYDLAMVLQFDNGKLSQVRCYVNRELPLE